MPNGVNEKIKQPKPSRLGVTFKDSKAAPLHRWYPYVEGFSAEYIQGHIKRYAGDGAVFDPFGGSGTVNLIASQSGHRSWFCEVNPLMRLIADAKINSVRELVYRPDVLADALEEFTIFFAGDQFARQIKNSAVDQYHAAFSERDFFELNDLRELLVIREAINNYRDDPALKKVLLVALASITVSCSHMTRRADLRRRRPGEYKTRIVDVRKQYLDRLTAFLADIVGAQKPKAPVVCVGPDSRKFFPELSGQVDLILTSPPYLNGTNYIRNTKLELWLLGFIDSEKDLSNLNKICMVCGISNVVKDRLPVHTFNTVEEVAKILDRESPDKRIPAMVRGYFSDMKQVLLNCRQYLRSGGSLVLDIGDSKFYGVHVPTDKLLIDVAESSGLRLTNENVLARRMSKDKTPLHQVELRFTRARSL